MTNSYNLNAAVNQNYAVYKDYYDNSNMGGRVTGSAVKSAALGFVGGTGIAAGVDYLKNRRPVRGDVVKESFAQKVFDKFIDKGYSAKGKNFFEQKKQVFEGLNSVKTPEEFRKLMKNNKKYAESLCDGISLEEMCDMVNKENVKDKVSALKKRIKTSTEPEMQNIKDSIKLCWDKTKKQFVKPDEVDNKLFKIIKNTKTDISWKKACKTGGIAAGILAAFSLGLSALALRARKRTMVQIQQVNRQPEGVYFQREQM